MTGENVPFLVAFTAGVLTFLSPCILPLIPSFIVYITGISLGHLKDEHKSETEAGKVHMKTITHTLVFIAGFSVVFILLGLTATAIGQVLFHYQKIIRMVGGLLIIFFGLTIMGVIKLGFMEKDHHFQVHAKKASYLGSFLVGLTFAAAWTPCAGPILGSILVIAGTEGSIPRGAALLALYSAGIAVPFLITALAINRFMKFFNKFKKVMGYVNIVGGILLVIVGIMIMTDSLNKISQIFLTLSGG
jgi:cytochrome c-type biogenesis protein